MWTIVFLAMGGIALGKGVESSGLLEILHEIIGHIVDGYSLYPVVLILSPIVLVRLCLLGYSWSILMPYPSLWTRSYRHSSVTPIASILLCPIAAAVGKSLPGNYSNLLVFITGLICSAGMGMPVSGFPNQTAQVFRSYLCRRFDNNFIV